MKIEAVDFFYLAMPEVTEAVDGSQDALLVRVQAGGHEGWGECEAAPLVSIASFVCPRSHGACRPLSESVLGQRLDDIADIGRIGDLARQQSLDLLQADHTLSGIDIALWDLLGKRLAEPVYRLPRLPARVPQTALCLAAVRRDPASHRSPGPGIARQRFSRRQIRLGGRSAPARWTTMPRNWRRRAPVWGRTASC